MNPVLTPTTAAVATGPEHRFIQPIDVLFMRGNKLFGNPGSHGESLVPPWPSVAAGALRSQLLAHDGTDLTGYAQGQIEHPSLGTPTTPGSFTLTAFNLARQLPDGSVQTLHSLPADLTVTQHDGGLHVQSLRPHAPERGLQTSGRLPCAPVLAETERRKAESGLWLTQAGWQKYLNGQLPNSQTEIIKNCDLWAIEARVGIGLQAEKRSADDGKLFTAQAIAFRPGVGFIASVRGARLPEQGSLRLGGDGRAAHSRRVALQTSQASLNAIAAQGRCRIVLTSPGLFDSGWLPNGFTSRADGSIWFNLCGVQGLLVCACVPRAETISGWDLARWQPKPALRAAPTGSVYWLEQLQATPEALGKLADNGLWSTPCQDTQRRAEGFNRFAFAAYLCA